MDKLHLYILLFAIHLLAGSPVQGQSLVQERIERYLFSSYESNKAGLRDREHVLKQLERKLDQYILSLDQVDEGRLQQKEKEFNAFLKQLTAVQDIQAVQQLVEESKLSHKAIVDRVLKEGIRSLEEAQDCRKAMTFRLMELEMMQFRQEQLYLLLKDEANRKKFIQSVLEKNKFSDNTDLRNLMVAVDLGLTQVGS